MMSAAVKTWLSVLLLAVGAYGSFTIWRVYQSHAVSTEAGRAQGTAPRTSSLPNYRALPPAPLERFTFTDVEGRPFPMTRMLGKVWVASYFFASCPGFCREMNNEIAALAEALADQDVTFVSFTVDPENDSPDVLKRYAEKLKANPDRWIFLTGPMAEISGLGQTWLKMPVSKEHNDKLVVIGRDGRIRDIFSSRDPLRIESFKKKLPGWIAEPPTDAE
jgi:protein SCO1